MLQLIEIEYSTFGALSTQLNIGKDFQHIKYDLKTQSTV